MLTPEETVRRRASESAAVAKLLNIRYDVWDINDCSLVADLETRRRLMSADLLENGAGELVVENSRGDPGMIALAYELLNQER